MTFCVGWLCSRKLCLPTWATLSPPVSLTSLMLSGMNRNRPTTVFPILSNVLDFKFVQQFSFEEDVLLWNQTPDPLVRPWYSNIFLQWMINLKILRAHDNIDTVYATKWTHSSFKTSICDQVAALSFRPPSYPDPTPLRTWAKWWSLTRRSQQVRTLT